MSAIGQQLGKLRREAQEALKASDNERAFLSLMRAWEIAGNDPIIADAFARTALACGRLDEVSTWAEIIISSRSLASPSILATALTAGVVSQARRNLTERYGADWQSTVQGPAMSIPSLGPKLASKIETFINESNFAAHKTSVTPVECPSCGEKKEVTFCNKVNLTDGFHLYFDLAMMAKNVFDEDPGDPGVLNLANAVLGIQARSNPDYFSVRLCECLSCGICFADHPFDHESVRRYYANEARLYEIGGQAIFSRAHAYDWVRSKAAPIAYLHTRLATPFDGLDFLDAGCAEGINCEQMRLLGAQPHGVEPNVRACRYAQELVNLSDVVQGEYNKQSFPGRVFDIVFSHHTMEHAVDPVVFAKQLAAHTKPGGHLLLQVPCADTEIPAQLSGIGNFHLFGFRRRYIESLLESLEFAILESHYHLGSTSPAVSDIDPVTKHPIWGESTSQITILCSKKHSWNSAH